MKEIAKKIFIRALHTFAQTMIGMIGTEQIGLFDVNWKTIISVCFMSALVSVLKSIVVGIPEDTRKFNSYGEEEKE